MLATEGMQLFNGNYDWPAKCGGYIPDLTIEKKNPMLVKQLFLNRYYELFGDSVE